MVAVNSQQEISFVQKPSTQKTLPCLCRKLSLILLLHRILGQNIVTSDHLEFVHVTSASRSTLIHRRCLFSTRLFSLGYILNFFFLLFYGYITQWIYLNLGDHLGEFFQGTDLYTLGFEIIAFYLQATLLILAARLNGPHLVRFLDNIQNSYTTLKEISNSSHSSDSKLSKNIPALSYLLLIKITITSTVYGCLFMYMIFGLSIPYKDEQVKNDPTGQLEPNNWRNFVFIAEKFAHFLVPFHIQAFVTLFIISTALILDLYRQITENLMTLMTLRVKNEEQVGLSGLARSNGRSLSQEVEKYRLLYEEVTKAVDYLGDYFGIGLLGVCGTAVLGMTAGIYSAILQQCGLSTGNIEMQLIHKYYFIAWAFHIYFAVFALLGIHLSGQRVTDGAKLPGRYLMEISQMGLDDELRYQINLFIRTTKLPVSISACGVTRMSMSFFASSSTQLITYILVLLQFRLTLSVNQNQRQEVGTSSPTLAN